MKHPKYSLVFAFLISLVALVSLFSLGFAQAEPGTLISVQLASGPHTGHFEISQQDTSCLYGTSNGDDWRTLYSTDTQIADNEISTVLLLISDITEAKEGSNKFFFSVGLGTYDSEDYFEYILDPQNDKGTGTVKMQKEGNQAVLNISGQTKAGAHLNTTITCNDVLEVNSQPKSLSDLNELHFGPDSATPTGSLSLSIADKNYKVQTGLEVTCNANTYEEDGLFSYSYYLDDESYNSLDLFIPDLEAAKKGTSDFGFAIDSFYLIYRTGEGSGTVQATQTDNRLSLNVKVISPEGIPVQAQLSCLLN